MRNRLATFVLVVLVLTGVVAALLLAGDRTPRAGPGAASSSTVPRLSRQVAAPAPLADVVQDQGNTVPLADGRTLWLFADTAHLTGRPAFFVTSSAGITDRGGLRLRYLTDGQHRPVEFLPRTPAEKADQVVAQHYTAVWPTGATALPDGRILIAYAKYQARLVPSTDFVFLGGGLFSYRYPGAQQPAQPATRMSQLWSAGDGPVASPVYSDGFVYFLRCQQLQCFSVRAPVAGLGLRAAYTWWTGSGWDHLRARAARLTFGSDVPGRNPAVAFDPRSGLFVMADTSGGIPSRSGRLWLAHRPWGPWSAATSFDLPQCPTQGCYTLNPHPLDSPPGTVRVSYATSGIGPFVRVVDVPVPHPLP